MISRNIYFNIIVRVLLILIVSLLSGYFLLIVKSVRFTVICFIIISILTLTLVVYLNRTNRNIKFFFDSVRNEDSSITFPDKTGNTSLNELHRSMKTVSDQIQQLKIENRLQEQYFQMILEHLATGIITYDKKGFIHHANSFAMKLLSINVLTHLRQIERIDHKLYQTIKSLKPFERRLVALNTGNGEVQLSLQSTFFKIRNDELIILSVQDIKHELDEKEIESWLKLIRVLIHEIMNSITPITSLSESLSGIFTSEGRQIEPEQVTSKTITTTLHGLNVIKEQGKGLLNFVEANRQLVHLPEPEMAHFRISDLFNRVKVLFDAPESRGKSIITFINRVNELEVKADQNLISQVLINIIKNAVEANEANPDGRITVIADNDLNNHPEISVADNGPGIGSEILDRIFIPFFTTRKNGSGIGLSISKQIMRLHGGTIKVKSVPAKETVFTLSFHV